MGPLESRLERLFGRPISRLLAGHGEKEEKGKKYHRIERSYGTFLRSFSLPEGVNGEKVTAEFSNGILEVRLPKDETAKPRAIEVKVR